MSERKVLQNSNSDLSRVFFQSEKKLTRCTHEKKFYSNHETLQVVDSHRSSKHNKDKLYLKLEQKRIKYKELKQKFRDLKEKQDELLEYINIIERKLQSEQTENRRKQEHIQNLTVACQSQQKKLEEQEQYFKSELEKNIQHNMESYQTYKSDVLKYQEEIKEMSVQFRKAKSMLEKVEGSLDCLYRENVELKAKQAARVEEETQTDQEQVQEYEQMGREWTDNLWKKKVQLEVEDINKKKLKLQQKEAELKEKEGKIQSFFDRLYNQFNISL